MRTRTLLTQVLAVNSLLVGITAIVAVVVTRDQLGGAASNAEGLLLLALAVFSAVLLNSLLIRRRLEPMERLVQTMDQVDLSAPGMRASPPRWAAREVQKLTTGFNRMLSRIEDERRQAGRAVLRGQEQERSRIAQDLHDEVNQALTGILLRLEATTMDAPLALRPELQETKRLANQAMDELLQLARQLRPTALDDHGLVPAMASQVRRFAAQTGIKADLSASGEPSTLAPDEEIAVFRIAQEALANVARHADASAVSVDLRTGDGGTSLVVRDDGRGFEPHRSNGHGLGLGGMAERARLVGGELTIDSRPGLGTELSLRVP